MVYRGAICDVRARVRVRARACARNVNADNTNPKYYHVINAKIWILIAHKFNKYRKNTYGDYFNYIFNYFANCLHRIVRLNV